MLFQIVDIESLYKVRKIAPTTTTISTTMSQPVIWSPDLFARTFLHLSPAFRILFFTVKSIVNTSVNLDFGKRKKGSHTGYAPPVLLPFSCH
jgi:hypothetical protein